MLLSCGVLCGCTGGRGFVRHCGASSHLMLEGAGLVTAAREDGVAFGRTEAAATLGKCVPAARARVRSEISRSSVRQLQRESCGARRSPRNPGFDSRRGRRRRSDAHDENDDNDDDDDDLQQLR